MENETLIQAWIDRLNKEVPFDGENWDPRKNFAESGNYTKMLAFQEIFKFSPPVDEDGNILIDGLYAVACGGRPWSYNWAETKIRETWGYIEMQHMVPWQLKRLHAAMRSAVHRGNVQWEVILGDDIVVDEDAFNENGVKRKGTLTVQSNGGHWNGRTFTLRGEVEFHEDAWGKTQVTGAGEGFAEVTSAKDASEMTKYRGLVVSDFLASMYGGLLTRRYVGEITTKTPAWEKKSREGLSSLLMEFAEIGDTSGVETLARAYPRLAEMSVVEHARLLSDFVLLTSSGDDATEDRVLDVRDAWMKSPENDLGPLIIDALNGYSPLKPDSAFRDVGDVLWFLLFEK